jgi:peptide/nickel transport system permease protein
MVRYLAGRVFQALLGLLFIATLVFFLVRLTGDPGRILTSEFAPVEVQQEIRERLGLDQPLYVQYVSYITGLATGDLGRSFNGEPVVDVLLERLPATASLAFAALLGTVALFGQSVPAFWLAIMLVLIFAVILRILPVAYSEGPESYVLPAIAIGWAAVAGIARLVRSSMLDVLGSDYVRMAHAKGLPSHVVVLKHGLRSAIVPVLTFSGLVLGSFLNGSVVVETVFAWPGIGELTLDAVSGRDFPVVQGAVLLIALFFITINLAVDVLYALADPRIRYR